eukprot:6197794-Pleurochrysis_carterae.AAC.1
MRGRCALRPKHAAAPRRARCGGRAACIRGRNGKRGHPRRRTATARARARRRRRAARRACGAAGNRLTGAGTSSAQPAKSIPRYRLTPSPTQRSRALRGGGSAAATRGAHKAGRAAHLAPRESEVHGA